MIENVSTQLTVFYCLCPLPASRKGLRLTLRSALFGEGGRDWRAWCDCGISWLYSLIFCGSLFCGVSLGVLSSQAIILLRKSELIALL